MKQWIYGAFSALGFLMLAALVFAWSGVYDISADTPHWRVTKNLLEWTRQRAITQAAKDVQVPDLSSQTLQIKGAGEYAAMCAQCHLAPGMEISEIHRGLNPTPPDFTKHAPDPARAFWIAKHGIKMTGMPAWGESHDDETLWSIVAFLQMMPKINAEQYRQWSGSSSKGAAAGSGPDGHGGSGHQH